MQEQEFEWAGRTWILAAFLALAGLVFHLILDEDGWSFDNPQTRNACATFVAVGSLSFALALERVRWLWAAGFAVFWGLIMAFVAWSTIPVEPYYNHFNYSFVAGLLAVTIALPLFQTVLKHGRLTLPYQDLHSHAWRNVVGGFASLLFVGISFLLINLLSELFELIGIDLLRELLRKEWFGWTYFGASFGAALGVLKENNRIVASIQGLVMSVLSLLAPALAFGLLLFLFALPFTGVQAFWDATRQTTPILLSCAIGALVLANAIIRDASSEESQHRIMRGSAIALALCVLPLSLLACFSMVQRIEQYALTPDRIWGMLAVLIGIAYGLGYLWSFIKSRATWNDNLRRNNTRLAIMMCLLLVVLSFGLVDFGKVSVDSQLARVTDGDLAAEKLDVTAFAFDFGPAGREALAEMEQSANSSLAKAASLALSAENRWSLDNVLREHNLASLSAAELIVYPQQVEVPKELTGMINARAACLTSTCLLLWEQGSDTARLVSPDCTRWGQYGFNPYTKGPPAKEGFEHCSPTVATMTKANGKWQDLGPHAFMINDEKSDDVDADRQAVAEAMQNGDFEIRTVERKQLFLGGKPVGDAFR